MSAHTATNKPPVPLLQVEELTMMFGETLIQRDISFQVRPGEIFALVGPSGCGKSTLLKHMIGLLEPSKGAIYFGGHDFWRSSQTERQQLLKGTGVLFQNAALWSSMTVAENLALPMQLHSRLSPEQIREQVAFKLALVGLAGTETHYPAALSGGMRKRAGLARALALDPQILFLDEPSAGLDPISSYRLDSLILQLRDTLGITVVMVTHELDSLMSIADDSLFLDAETRTAIARGNPRHLRQHSPSATVRAFLSRQDPSKADTKEEDRTHA